MSGSFATMSTLVNVHNSNLQANSAKKFGSFVCAHSAFVEKKRKEREKKEASWKVLKETTSDFQAT